jgi:hypothetical protein
MLRCYKNRSRSEGEKNKRKVGRPKRLGVTKIVGGRRVKEKGKAAGPVRAEEEAYYMPKLY